jgi:hypothetical protein
MTERPDGGVVSRFGGGYRGRMPRAIQPTSLDHVAFWVDQREPLARFLCDHLGMHVIEQTDTFTLVGVDAKLGKLTLFDADLGPEGSRLSALPSTAPASDRAPLLALGRGLPDAPWTIRQRDRIYGLLIAGGQGSGKSSLLLRVAMSDVLSANTATVVLDMKGTLSERLLRLTPPDIAKRWWDEETGRWQEGQKRLWYLDLGRPAFGLTPLRIEPGWTHAGLADEFARVADAICRALLDL